MHCQARLDRRWNVLIASALVLTAGGAPTEPPAPSVNWLSEPGDPESGSPGEVIALGPNSGRKAITQQGVIWHCSEAAELPSH